jgi:hypothetical protein
VRRASQAPGAGAGAGGGGGGVGGGALQHLCLLPCEEHLAEHGAASAGGAAIAGGAAESTGLQSTVMRPWRL